MGVIAEVLGLLTAVILRLASATGPRSVEVSGAADVVPAPDIDDFRTDLSDGGDTGRERDEDPPLVLIDLRS